MINTSKCWVKRKWPVLLCLTLPYLALHHRLAHASPPHVRKSKTIITGFHEEGARLYLCWNMSARAMGRAMGSTELSSLPLAPANRDRLLRAGFRTLRDVEGVQPLDLSRGVQCTAVCRRAFHLLFEPLDISGGVQCVVFSLLGHFSRSSLFAVWLGLS